MSHPFDQIFTAKILAAGGDPEAMTLIMLDNGKFLYPEVAVVNGMRRPVIRIGDSDDPRAWGTPYVEEEEA